MKTKHLPVSAGVSLILLLVAFSSFGAGGRHFVRGDLPAAVARLSAVENLSSTNQLQLAIALPLRNQEGLNSLLKDIYDPVSANYRHYLTPEQFAENFGPTKSDYQALIQFVERNGLKVTATHPNRAVLDVAGSVADIEKTFQVKMQVYRHPKEQRDFYAPNTEPSVESSLAVPLLSISGLNNYSLPHPMSLHMMPASQPPGATPYAGSGPGLTYQGRDFRLAYLPGVKLNGTGQSVALLEFDGYYSNDITAYEVGAKLPFITLTNIKINGGITTPGSGNGEVALDIEMAISMATNLSSVVVYEAPLGTPWLSMLQRMANDNLAAQISCSWGGGNPNPDPASDQVFKQMALQGQSFFSASGDDDAISGPATFPDDNPYITLVGGSTLTTASKGGTYVSETVWNRNNGTGTGGGISLNYPIPSWQQGVSSFPVNGGSTAARNSPDVALTAENVYVTYNNGGSGPFGGTSCAAPLWAGMMALANQQAVASGQPLVGFINPVIYEIANETIYNSAFHDITTGNNTSTDSPGAFYAVAGYDLCTGLGTPRSTNLINALVSPDPFIVVSNAGFRAASLPGGGFNQTGQTYYLTNVGASALTWSLSNTSAWLNATSTGGTLASGASGSVVVSLNMVASNLNVGTYAAYLWFSNNASGVAHGRFFTLKVSNSLLQNGDFETGDFSGWTLAGNVFENGTLYNGVVGTTSLTDGSGPAFIHSGNYGAFLGDTNPATLSQTIKTVPGRSYLLSFWLANPVIGSGQQFLVNWNTNSMLVNQIYFLTNPPVLPWTNITFFVQATDTNTTLQFGAENPPDGFGLDDVNLIEILPPAFTTQPPTNLTALVGSTVVISATAGGTAPLAYQWLQNGVSLGNAAGISGATTPSLMLAGVTTNNTANYTLVVTNAYGAITSSVAALTVVLPPGITGVAANPGGGVTLNLTGSPGVSYVLESTTNLVSSEGWQPVATNVFDLTGAWQFNDTSATNFTQRFYRLKYSQQ